MTRALQALLIGLPLLVAGVVVLVRRRRGERMPGVYLLGLLGMVAMAGFWWYYAGLPDYGPEAAWFVGLVAALIAVVVAASAKWGARTVLASAVVAPFAFLAFTASLYAFGEGVIDESGVLVPFMEMAPVSLILACTLYVVPALVVWVLLRQGSQPPKTAAPGWYPDPGDPARRRFWDGKTWTDRTSSAEAAPHRTA
jgi:peptidoglycan/LPS O-acetylase OafA/YrhL